MFKAESILHDKYSDARLQGGGRRDFFSPSEKGLLRANYLATIENQMRTGFPALKARWVRMILLIGVLASLCFSVGEGLRLLPLPSLSPSASERVDTRARMTSPSASPLNQFQAGSITQPPQAQQILKRKQTPWTPTAHCDLPLPNSLCLLSGAAWRAVSYPTESASRQAGRAPPRTA
jgi:hypothetical protein